MPNGKIILDGKTVLIAEREFLIALEIRRALEVSGRTTMIFAHSPANVEALRSRWTEVDLAIIEVSREDDASISLAKDMRAAGIPVVVCSASTAARKGLPGLSGTPVVMKPFLEADLIAACRLALGRSLDG